MNYLNCNNERSQAQGENKSVNNLEDKVLQRSKSLIDVVERRTREKKAIVEKRRFRHKSRLYEFRVASEAV